MTSHEHPSDAEVQRTGGLQVLEEKVLAELPRARSGEVLRVTLVRALTREQTEVSWASIRLFFTDRAGALRPTKSGITVRLREIDAVVAALVKATPCSSAPGPARSSAPRTPPSGQPSLPGVQSRARRPITPFVPPPPPPDDGVDTDEVF